jgi:dipeptidyl aminopeptidase/acylaminoacyl peptidase
MEIVPMRRPFVATRLALALFATPAVALLAQSPAPATSDAKRALTLADYGKWARITSSAISSDGAWMSVVTTPNDGDATLIVKQLAGDKSYTVSLGAEPAGAGRGGGGGGGGGGGAPLFSDDAHWIAYVVNPPDRTGAPAGGGGRGGRGGGAPGAPATGGRGAGNAAVPAVPARRLELMNLATGEKATFPSPATFRFAKGSKTLAVRLNKADATAKHNGADLLLRDLAAGTTRNVGNVNAYEFNDVGAFVAYTVDAADKQGNGIYLLNLASGETKALNSAAADYDQLAWNDDGSSLSALRGEKKSDQKQKENVLLAWRGVTSGSAATIEYDPSKDAAFPKDFVVSEFTAPRWSKDGSRLFFGIKEQEREVPAADSLKANVDVWHWKDPEIQSVQIVRVQQERRATYPAAFLASSRKFVRLGDEAMRTVTNTPNGKWGLGRLDAPYRGEVQWGGNKADLMRVNTETGERTLIEKALTRIYSTSPDSKWVLYLKDKRLKAFNLETAKSVDVNTIAGEKSFIDADDDHPYEKPIWGVAGWAKDGSVLLYDKYDVWQVPLDGGKVVNLTNGIGKTQNIQFRVVRLTGGRGGRGGRGGGAPGAGAEDEDGMDLSKPLTLSAYGEWSKKSGYWTVTAGKAPTPLIWADKSIGGAQKAEGADRVLFTQQSFTEFPDLWTSGADFANAKKVTDVNPQISDFAWGKRILVDFTNSKGKKLQATVTLPANYVQGKQYPTLVYFYEILSNTHHTFSQPVYDDRPHFSAYASNGYLVVQPDIVYETGKPGSSALDCVTSAVKKVIAMGLADPKHIGLQGHSWGGYETSFILTQTDMFATVVTGAPPADLVSMYDQLYKQTGTVNHGIFEIGQVRMGDGNTPWTARELYESQSPVHNVRNIKTPFLILQGTDDGAVDWLQGVEWYNAARRWGKEVVFLSYPGEPHHLAKKENQKDFQIRMKQWFDHYLMGAPAPKWMTDGVPQTKKGGPLQ